MCVWGRGWGGWGGGGGDLRQLFPSLLPHHCILESKMMLPGFILFNSMVFWIATNPPNTSMISRKELISITSKFVFFTAVSNLLISQHDFPAPYHNLPSSLLPKALQIFSWACYIVIQRMTFSVPFFQRESKLLHHFSSRTAS